MIFRAIIVVLSLVLLGYSCLSVVLGLGKPGVTNDRWCKLWLCPEEFSDAKVADLIRSARDPDKKWALEELERAVRFDSASAYAWANLGDALVNANQISNAGRFFESAVERAPKNPIVLMRAANYEVLSVHTEKVLNKLSVVLRDLELSSFYEPIFLTYSRIDVPLQQLLGRGIPKMKGPAQAFLRSLFQEQKIPEAEETWKWLIASQLTDDQLTGEYVVFLIGQNRPEAAANVWAQINANTERGYRSENWVFNPTFANEPRGCELDWKLEPSDDVKVERSSDGLKLSFLGRENIDFQGVSQHVVLAPGKWIARAEIRTENLTTDQGVRLRVLGKQFDLATEAMTGTHDWATIEERFQIGDHDHPVVRLGFERTPSRRLDFKIEGTAWIRDVEIRPDRTAK